MGVSKASSDQLGLELSAATAGKTWSQIQTITADMKAGEAPLGAAYSALSLSEKKAFDHSSASMYASGLHASGSAVVEFAPSKGTVVEAAATTAAPASAGMLSADEKKLKKAIQE